MKVVKSSECMCMIEYCIFTDRKCKFLVMKKEVAGNTCSTCLKNLKTYVLVSFFIINRKLILIAFFHLRNTF